MAALAAAVWAGVTARRLYEVERARDEVAALQRRRRDAQRVAGWCAVHFHDDGREDGLVIVNDATTPVYDMTITSNDGQGRAAPVLRLQVIPPGSYFAHRTGTEFHWSFPDEVGQLGGNIRPIMKKPEWRVTEMTFRDASDAQWRRDASGRLSSLD